MPERRCLLVSNYNADRRPWNGVPFEFLRVVADLEDATILAPAGKKGVFNDDLRTDTLTAELGFRIRRRLMRQTTGRYLPLMQPVDPQGKWDILFFVCQFLEEVQEIEQIAGWRDKAKTAVIFLLEGWTSTFPKYRREIALLSRFDHVFVLNGSSVKELRQRVTAPVTQLSTACDVLEATPPVHPPARAIDLICFGRWRDADHDRLVRMSEAEGLFYYYDVWRGLRATDWAAIRRRNAELIRRSRYYLVWEPDAWHQLRRDGRGRDVTLSTRYFEGAAGGAVLLGSAPEDCPEFDAAFDWPDALIPLGDDPEEVIHALDADPMRVLRARTANVVNSLRRHDWAHRWAEVLRILGLAPTEAHLARLVRLNQMAALIDRASLPHAGMHRFERGMA